MLEAVADGCQGRRSPVSLRGSRSKPRRLAAWPCHGSRGGRRNRQRSRSRLRRRRRPSLPTSHGSVPRAARPTVAVWTAPDTSRFLTGMETDELRTLLYLVALRGLRRGEAARSVLAQRQSRRGNPDDQPDPSRTPRWFGVAAAKPAANARTIAWTAALLRSWQSIGTSSDAQPGSTVRTVSSSPTPTGRPSNPSYLRHHFRAAGAPWRDPTDRRDRVPEWPRRRTVGLTSCPRSRKLSPTTGQRRPLTNSSLRPAFSR
jgi:hypothetical protein